VGQMEDDGADVDVAEEVAFVAYTIQNKACRVAHHNSILATFGEAAPEQTWVEVEEASQLLDVFLDED
jgi:hypothetical protein